MNAGYHVSKDGYGSLAEALRAAINKHEIGAAQIFVQGPQSSRMNLSDEDEAAIRNVVDEHGLWLAVHSAYVNAPWSGKANSIMRINSELQVAERIGAKGLVVHLGAGCNNDMILRTVLTTIAESPVTLFLEINAAKPSADTWESPEKLATLFTKIRLMPLAINVGLCIDTAHLSSCGRTLTTRQAMSEWLNVITNAIPDLPIMFHLNDSDAEPGRGKDLHAGLKKGVVWRDDDSGLIELVNRARHNEWPLILERDGHLLDDDIDILKNIH